MTYHPLFGASKDHGANKPLLPARVRPQLTEAQAQKARIVLVRPVRRQAKTGEALCFLSAARQDGVEEVLRQRNELEAIGLD